MQKNRLEAFSDGVIAIILTIMVLELHVPETQDWEGLQHLFPTLLSYVISFLLVGTFWNNHHHMLHAARNINGRCLWANLHLLFWLSLIPFATAWMGKNFLVNFPVMFYSFLLLMACISYQHLARELIAAEGRENSKLAHAIGSNNKGLITLILALVSIPIGYFSPLTAQCIFAGICLMWVIPDKKIEAALASHS